MKTLYCWRCRKELPMLDEREWEQIAPYLSKVSVHVKKYIKEHDCSLKEAIQRMQQIACQMYYEMTGCEETNPVALFHHRLSLLGSICKKCGKPFRTPKAKYCAECGSKKMHNNEMKAD